MNYLNKSFDGIFKLKKNSQKSAEIFDLFFRTKKFEISQFWEKYLFHPFGLKDVFFVKINWNSENIKMSDFSRFTSWKFAKIFQNLRVILWCSSSKFS